MAGPPSFQGERGRPKYERKGRYEALGTQSPRYLPCNWILVTLRFRVMLCKSSTILRAPMKEWEGINKKGRTVHCQQSTIIKKMHTKNVFVNFFSLSPLTVLHIILTQTSTIKTGIRTNLFSVSFAMAVTRHFSTPDPLLGLSMGLPVVRWTDQVIKMGEFEV